MSDFILKVFPLDEINIDKTDLIKTQLLKKGFLSGSEIEYYGESFLEAGECFHDFFNYENEITARDNHKSDARIKLVADGYGIATNEDSDEPDFIDRKNVIEIWNIDGNYKSCNKLLDELKEVTGDTYTAEWEIL